MFVAQQWLTVLKINKLNMSQLVYQYRRMQYETRIQEFLLFGSKSTMNSIMPANERFFFLKAHSIH